MILHKVFSTECRGEPDCRLSQVIEGPIHFFALCEHHALLFYGQAYVGYIAHETMLQPHGVAVYLEAHHLCTQMRGVREIVPMTRTTVWRGHFADDAALRAEFFTACGLPK